MKEIFSEKKNRLTPFHSSPKLLILTKMQMDNRQKFVFATYSSPSRLSHLKLTMTGKIS